MCPSPTATEFSVGLEPGNDRGPSGEGPRVLADEATRGLYDDRTGCIDRVNAGVSAMLFGVDSHHAHSHGEVPHFGQPLAYRWIASVRSTPC